MTTGNPGRFAGGRGVLCPGTPADMVRFSLDTQQKRLTIDTVLIEGVELH
jgi:hypothetical protein